MNLERNLMALLHQDEGSRRPRRMAPEQSGTAASLDEMPQPEGMHGLSQSSADVVSGCRYAVECMCQAR